MKRFKGIGLGGLVDRQQENIHRIQVTWKSAEKRISTTCSTSALQLFADQIQNHWEQFKDIHEIILERTDGELDEKDVQILNKYKQNDVYGTAEELYINYVSTLKEIITTKGAEAKIRYTAEAPRPAPIRLPQIDLPKFSGKYSDWRAFQDLFASLIHRDTAIPEVQKLHYLKSCVTGEAATLLHQYETTDDNYEKAWECLSNRYNNERILITTHLKTLFQIPTIKTENATSIRLLIDRTAEVLHELKTLKMPTESWSGMLVYLTTSKLPIETIKAWEEHQGNSTTFPDYSRLTQFLETRFRVLEASINASNKDQIQISRRPVPSLLTTGTTGCQKCKGQHRLNQCEAFRRLPFTAKNEFVRRNKLCYNCLSDRHDIYHCQSKYKCSTCKRKHHSLLHNPAIQAPRPREVNTDQDGNSTIPEPQSSTALHTQNPRKQVLLATAIVNVETSNGRFITLRALLDSGSHSSFITNKAQKRIQLRATKINPIQVAGLGGGISATTTSFTKFKIHSLHNDFSTDVEALVIPRITGLLPTVPLDIRHLQHIKNLKLADPKFQEPQAIDLLLGADIYSSTLIDGLLRQDADQPVVQNTTLGWIVSGPLTKGQMLTTTLSFLSSEKKAFSEIENSSVDRILKRFWEIEELPTKIIQTPIEQQCEQIYKKTTTRAANGTYSVQLPFKSSGEPNLGSSRSSAVAQFLRLEKRFQQNPDYAKLYKECIQDYRRLHHMIPTSSTPCLSSASTGYYLPHHGVLKESSSTTKLRVVFNASSKTSNGESLNDQMLVGPTIQPTLWTTLLKWRNYKYVFTADIEKMYRMIHMHEDHQKYQKIIWRDSPYSPLQDFVLTTVIFGTAAAPFLAIRTLHQVAIDEEQNFPEASQIIRTQCYVDDLTSGCWDLDHGKSLQKDLILLLKKGGFKLHKWTGNHPHLIEHIPQELREIKEFLKFESIKTLGIRWYPAKDQFGFIITLPIRKEHYTKRNITSEVASLFDPFGWLAPVIILGKIILQLLWTSGCSWDEDVPEYLQNKWIELRSDLIKLNNITIPRWTQFNPNQKVEIHGFCDASETSYAAVVYLKTTTDQGSDHITLLAAKTKVAPIKTISLPRLELCGALLLSKLLKQVINDLQLPFQQVNTFAWTDSLITLAWIQSNPHRWKTFVANRVSEIQTEISPENWRYVPTKDNPADCASRGMMPSTLIEFDLWWKGPPWLIKDSFEWPEQHKPNPPTIEQNKTITCLVQADQTSILRKYSSFSKLTRIMAYLLRFLRKPKHKGHLTLGEIEAAERKILHLVQRESFPGEIDQLKKRINISNSSKIKNLHPFLDNEGLLRVGGRIDAASINFSSKHPIILPNKHHITDLIIDAAHRQTLHGGTQLVLNTLRNKYWIIAARNRIKQRIQLCINCIRASPTQQIQLMGDLPSHRINMSLPFEHTGVDFAGPIELKASRLKTSKIIKGYICVFVCMATKAIHLEIATDLTAECFIAALRRFTSRRGRCRHLYSDQGRNFIKTKRLFYNQLTEERIEWHLNPPSAPHFGGIWEAGVKSVKTHLKRTLQNTKLTYEELYTVLCQIEACLNSRPIIPITHDINKHFILTPGHFLTGRNILAVPDVSIPDSSLTMKRWNFLQKLVQQFWKVWRLEYLHSLQQRYKWKDKQPNLQIGDIVLIKNELVPPTKWPIGKITEVFPGKDELIRVVKVQTAEGSEFQRPIAKITKLPITDRVD